MFSPDSLAFRRALVVLLCSAAAVFVGYQIPEAPIFALMVVGLAVYLLTVTVNYQWCAWLIVAAAPSAFIIPSLPGRPFLWEALCFAAWPSLIAHFAVHRHRLGEIRVEREARRALLCLLVYAIMLVAVMLTRGVGFRVFGGEQMGGRYYLQQFLLMVLPLLCLSGTWRERGLLTAYFTGAALTLTYLVSDLALVYGGRAAGFLLTFLEVPTDAVNFYLGYEFTGLRRFQSFAFVGSGLMLVVLILVPLREAFGRKAFFALPWLAGALALGLASGHRTVLVQILLTLAFLGYYQRVYTPRRLLLLLVIALAVVGGLVKFSEDLPIGVQRALSAIPGVKVDPVAEADASATLRDRIEVLKLGVQDVPRYLWIGRGYGLERLDRIHSGAGDDHIYTYYVNGYFVNGTFGLLIKSGLIGFLAALGYFYYVSQAAVRLVGEVRARPEEEHDLFDRFSQLVAAQWFSVMLFFLVLHGEAGLFMQQFALPSALVLTCLTLQRRRREERAAALVAQPAS